MNVTAGQLRIGEIAERTGVTARTIRYYEELGLLPRGEREQGKHRVYTEADVERLGELTQLRDLLGLTLEELRSVVTAEEARDELRRRFETAEPREERLRIVETAVPHLETQLGLVRRRLGQLQQLEADLLDRRRRLQRRRRELS